MNKPFELKPPTYLIIYLIAAVVLHFLFPVIRLIYPPYNYLGVILIAFGVFLNFWANTHFKNENTTVKTSQKPSNLLTEGPFRYSRHPMYLGFVLILLGVTIFLGSLSALISPIAMFATLQYQYIPFEEKLLEEIFQEKYKEYQKKVRRWL